MQPGNKYIVKTATGINTMQIITQTVNCVKVSYGNGCVEWVYRTDFKTCHGYIDPKIKILEKLM